MATDGDIADGNMMLRSHGNNYRAFCMVHLKNTKHNTTSIPPLLYPRFLMITMFESKFLHQQVFVGLMPVPHLVFSKFPLFDIINSFQQFSNKDIRFLNTKSHLITFNNHYKAINFHQHKTPKIIVFSLNIIMHCFTVVKRFRIKTSVFSACCLQ